MSARAIMVLGTSSHVGKSLLVAALCRIFAQHGVRVAPFKSQNMSLNSAATPEGLEIGRAQALQAEAAGIAPSVHMNPILLKPMGDMRSQIVVHGRIWGSLSASDYHLRRVEELMPAVRESYATLAESYDVVVIEGAGSPAEINLKQHDIVNMRIAAMADARCLLVGDIDRGGVFASLLGTVLLLDPEEQARIDGFAINKFRGDLSLLASGVHRMEQRLAKPCLGVVPFLQDLKLDEEDSVGLRIEPGLKWKPDTNSSRPLNIAVIALPSFSNFTDFDALLAEPSIALHFVRTTEALTLADVVILPGSKQTVDDLLWLRAQGLDAAIEKHAIAKWVVGICGGMQMLGHTILDSEGIEHAGTFAGLGLLPIHTTMLAHKITSLAHGAVIEGSTLGAHLSGIPVCGYEIHVGETTYLEHAAPFARIARLDTPGTEYTDGCIAPAGHIFGTYLHGLFDEDAFRHAFLADVRAFYTLSPATEFADWKTVRENELNRLASHVEAALDMNTIFRWAGLRYESSKAEPPR
ncbi:adenosylcobyric acid synthase (glutamine-hydrolysing) [Granulicella pectinivorans]|uniref:Cobyric acid synthase n=1 Tax=Granulicella pectinivorans TaxID=474950 RepID=A0A1I6MQV0_9BACT|nr:cobyric acid synthase [Granulicella pectinivorans]SFS18080.1 adenosylcobyric acid synthase (glutamine-hydrolysing) [Granulicella pectinivorans]